MCDPEQEMVLVEGGGEAEEAVDLGLVLGGPAGGSSQELLSGKHGAGVKQGP